MVMPYSVGCLPVRLNENVPPIRYMPGGLISLLADEPRLHQNGQNLFCHADSKGRIKRYLFTVSNFPPQKITATKSETIFFIFQTKEPERLLFFNVIVSRCHERPGGRTVDFAGFE